VEESLVSSESILGKEGVSVCGDGTKDVVKDDTVISPPSPVEVKNTREVESTTTAVAKLDQSDMDDEEDELDVVGTYLCNMPPEVKKRVCALRKNQKEVIDIETQFYLEMHQLEIKYEKLYKEKFDVRQGVITGSYDPTPEECDFPLESESFTPIPIPVFGCATNEGDKPGIPMFWATVLKTVDPMSTMIEKEDIPVLKHLTDIRYENTSEPLGFVLYFDFTSNDYFENTVLTKSYVMKNDPDIENPFTYEGPEIVSCQGCVINWKEGKKLTSVVVDKRQKHKKTGIIRTVSKTVKLSSFFHFFSPPEPMNGKITDEEEEEDMIDALNVDFEIGQTLRERIIPRAVLLFTGEGLEDDDYASATETDVDDEDENDEESDEDEVDEQGDSY